MASGVAFGMLVVGVLVPVEGEGVVGADDGGMTGRDSMSWIPARASPGFAGSPTFAGMTPYTAEAP